jgi:glycine hydroxymethyltransferase
MSQIAAWMDEAITAAAKEDEPVLERIAAEVRDLMAGFPMPGWVPASP